MLTSWHSWTTSKTIQANQARKSCFSIYGSQNKFGYFNPKDGFKFFDSMIKRILCFNSDVCGYEYSHNIGKVHIDFCKRMCCLNLNTADCFALSECGRYPLSVMYMIQCIKYWIKLTEIPTTRYPKQCYHILRRLDENGRKT